MIGGEQRTATGLADALVDDDAHAVQAAVRDAFARGVPAAHRTEQVAEYLERLARIDPANVTPETMRDVFKPNEAATPRKEQ